MRNSKPSIGIIRERIADQSYLSNCVKEFRDPSQHIMMNKKKENIDKNLPCFSSSLLLFLRGSSFNHSLYELMCMAVPWSHYILIIL